MITEEDLLRAIRQCEQGPESFGSCERLATLYTVYDHLYGNIPKDTYSAKGPPVRNGGHGQFARVTDGKDPTAVLAVFDELMEDVLKYINPRLYESVLKELSKM